MCEQFLLWRLCVYLFEVEECLFAELTLYP